MAIQLPSLPDVKKLSERVIRILGGNPGKFTLQGTNTYLVGTGDERLLLDTGEGHPSWVSNLQSVLADEKATVKDVLLTHWHPDHMGGVKDLLSVCPNAKVFKNLPEDGQSDISNGQIFNVKGATLRAYHTPGHTDDHMAFSLEEEDALFTGDNVLGHGTSIFEDLGIYLATLEKMQHIFSGRAYPAHGEVIEDGKRKIAEYIEHRQQREDEVIQVLKFGTLGQNLGNASKLQSPSTDQGKEPRSWTPLELVKVIYRDVPENLHVPASHGVLQVLKKLKAGNRVSHDAATDRWTLQV